MLSIRVASKGVYADGLPIIQGRRPRKGAPKRGNLLQASRRTATKLQFIKQQSGLPKQTCPLCIPLC
jgi:hypothetical protein